MASSIGTQTCDKPADEYGRLNYCFQDHLGPPFRLRDHLAELRNTRKDVELDGLTSQSGLLDVPLPEPDLVDDTLDDEDHISDFMEQAHDLSLNAPPLGHAQTLDALQLPMSDSDLGSNHATDVQDYHSEIAAKKYCNIADQWLPLSPVKVDKDESLSFPPNCDRLQSLLLRELEREGISTSAEAAILEMEADESPLFAIEDLFPAQRELKRQARQSFGNIAEPITPPLSPVSDNEDEPFIPKPGTAFIDLTSEPNSPNNSEFEVLQQKLKDGTLDSDPPLPSSMTTCSPSPGKPPCSGLISRTSQDLKVDIPVAQMSSDTASNDGFSAEPRMLPVVEVEEPPNFNIDSYFDEAFEATLEGSRINAAQLIEQEHLNPCDSVSRVPVPMLNFVIAKPEWAAHRACAKAQFRWLSSSTPASFHIPPIARDAQLDSVLKWTPVPRGDGHISANEDLPRLGIISRQMLSVGFVSTLTSASLVSLNPTLAVLKPTEDEEIEGIFEESSASVENSQPLDLDPLETPRELGIDMLRNREVLDIRKRPYDNESMGVLPRLNDSSATSKLLSGFMELRAVKRTRFSKLETPLTKMVSQIPAHETSPQKDDHTYDQAVNPAPAPDINFPQEKGSFIVSVDLERSIIRNMEKSWPQDHLIDRDFSRHNTMPWSHGTVRPKEIVSPLSLEADVCLTPSVGIVVTSLLKVRQKPLPGSKAQTPLRERVEMVSHKYESLVVLVSSSNITGEPTENPSRADLCAYAEFVCFAAGLRANVTTYFITGAADTLSKWILNLMGRYTPETLARKRLFSPEETTWEMFLRRAGMNVVAAQVLSGVLFEEAGAQGLAQFITMSLQERVSRYATILGGSKTLQQSSRLLEQNWG